MKIAIVAPSPVPFTIGGVENLLWGMLDWMNQNTEHQVELLKLPSRENSFWDLIKTYESFYHLDLSYFDMIISTKYPAWMVPHKNHVCYLQHRLRGLYDTYHFTHLPIDVKRGNFYVDQILKYMDINPTPSDLDCFFEQLWELREHLAEIPAEYFSFPGPFIRRVIHYLDDFALSKRNIKKFLCISNTVKNRKEYFPSNCTVTPIHHPSNLKTFSFGEYKHIFMVSRLDGPKRIDLLIKAMSYVKSDIKLFIAGTGPQEKELKELAKQDKRIEFLGFVNDETVENYYKNSLVIPYFPYDEDYGLITIEAMMHAKPVITTTDAGGPTEFVSDNETGFVVPLDPRIIGEKIDYFAENPNEAKRMGNQAYELVSKITWERVINSILDSNISGVSPVVIKPRKRITVTSTFPIYPPQGGGQARIYNLYKNIAQEYDVEIVSFTNHDQKAFHEEIADGVTEIRVPKTQQHQEKEWEMEKGVGVSISDIAMITLSGETPEYCEALRKSISKSDLVVISHPYLYNEVKKHLKDKRFVYEAHNVESVMKKEMLPDTKVSKAFVQSVFDTESECCKNSIFIMTCSDEDQNTLHNTYLIPREKMITIPNGVDTSSTHFITIEERIRNKSKLGLSNEKIGLFMGSWHKPNLDACEFIFELALKCPATKFLLMGSQCAYFEQKKITLPFNVGMLGLVSDTQKDRIFSIVDFALNPMTTGSGTNLKMFDYMAAGIPIISTEFGTRGITQKDGFIVCSNDDMDTYINQFILQEQRTRVDFNYHYVKQEFEWEVIARRLCQRLNTIF